MLLPSALLLFASVLPASPVFEGRWYTPDKSLVQVHPCSGGAGLCLELIGVGNPAAPKTDAQNPDASLRARPLCGLEIGSGFVPQGQEAKGGKLYDPESGRTYSGSMKLDSTDVLKLHGFIGVAVLGRTEVWRRAADTVKSCKQD